jgi:hypothetical protein
MGVEISVDTMNYFFKIHFYLLLYFTVLKHILCLGLPKWRFAPLCVVSRADKNISPMNLLKCRITKVCSAAPI